MALDIALKNRISTKRSGYKRCEKRKDGAIKNKTVKRNHEIEEEKEDDEHQRTTRRVYTCSVCKEPTKNTRHTHFREIRYCQNELRQVQFEEWITQRHTEFKIFNY